jgi:ABC-type transport system involved in multi-copper enzyme maturation permease subunit
MISIHKILTVARYEMKTLLRSWFFRIFAGLAIVILTFMNVPFFALKGQTPWLFRGISSSIPYFNILLLNIVQAIIAVFLASDFLKRDKKLDTTEVVYMRSMNNSDYVLGKLSGILMVFLALNVIVLIIGAVFNIFFSDVPVVFAPYLLYPLFISVPTLVFIFGLSFLFMVTIRNQAVTFIILLGYIALTLFFLSAKFHYLFDYITFNVPMMYSDFVGFGNLSTLLIHRGMYLLFGLGFVFGTILLIKRLPQSKVMTRVSAVLTTLFIGGALVLGVVHVSRLTEGKNLRAKMVKLNKASSAIPKLTLLNCELDVKHAGKAIQVRSNLKIQNNTSDTINKYLFSLNPGLKVLRVTSNQENLKFDRNIHLLEVTPVNSLAPGATDSLTISYQGKINEQACFVDIDEKARTTLYRAWMYNIAKRFSFVEPEYVLLTPESMWYPVAGLPYGATYPDLSAKDFIHFQLNVKTSKKLTAISQGNAANSGDGNFTFKIEQPIPQLSLAIGNYERKSIEIDSVEYSLFNLKGHDYYSEYFKDISDTLTALIREMKQDYENKLGLSYSYPRLTLVETPIQFFSYQRQWTSGQETVQPQMILLPEKGLLLDRADFSQMTRWQKRRQERSNQTMTPQEIQSDLFRGFVNSSFLSGSSRGFMMGDLVKTPLNYNIFPNFYTFANNFSSKQWPVFNIALESFLIQKSAESAPSFRRFFVGLSDDEKANLALMEQNLVEILADPEKKDIVNTVLKLKGNYLFKLIESKLGQEKFQKFLSEFLTNSHFKNVDVTELISLLKGQFNFDIETYFNTWYQERQLPAYVIADVEAYKVLDKDRTRYQIKFKVSNSETVSGLLSVTFRTGGGGGRFFGFGRPPQEPTQEKLITLQPGETKEIGFVLDDSPRMMMVNTLISKNLPSTIAKNFDELELNEKASPFDGERILNEPIKFAMPNEIIVDNEDPGFQLLDKPSRNWLKKLLAVEKTEDKYIGMNFWHAPNRWRGTTNDDFYGKFIHSAYYIKAGDGNKKVAWKAKLDESGSYDVYYYTSNIRPPWGRRRDEGRRDEFLEQFHFRIHHDDGIDDAALDVSNAEGGWAFLGTYYLSTDTARVELTDKSKGRIVVADAVKWVKL